MGIEVKRKIQLRAGEATIKRTFHCAEMKGVKNCPVFVPEKRGKTWSTRRLSWDKNKAQEIVETSSSRTSRVLTCEKKKCR